MRIFITGATGFVGRTVVARLLGEGHELVAWVRDPVRGRGALGTDVTIASPKEGMSLAQALKGCEAVINLQGENLFARRWSSAQKRKLEESRVAFTRELGAAITSMGADAPSTLVSASAVGYYGADVSEEVTEDSPAGDGYLSELCEKWEAEALSLESQGVRVVTMRIGVVLGRDGGALEKMLPLFRLGLGGRLGTGRQIVSWIHLSDLVSLIHAALTDDRYAGPVNATSPEPISNRELTKALARSVGKSAVFPAPSIALRLVLGEASSVLLGGQRALPRRAQALDFRFEFDEIDLALEDILCDDTVRIGACKEPGADYVLEQETIVDEPIADVFSFFSKAENLGAMTPPDLSFAMRGPAPTNMSEGTRLEYDIKLGPVPMRWASVIERWTPGVSFVDSQVRGPYAHWSHEHSFEAIGDQTLMRDTVQYRLPMGFLGRAVHSLFVRSKLKRIFAFRSYFTSVRFRRRSKSQKARAA